MYSIIGADDKEYGPVEVTTLVTWAREGRVVERTTILDHATGRRYLACDMEPLAAVFEQTRLIAPAAGRGGIVSAQAPPQPVRSTTHDDIVNLRPRRSRIVAGVLGVTLGCFGVHRFYLGYTGTGTLMLVLGLTMCGLPFTALWGLAEGVICLLGGMTDADGRPLGV